MTLREFFIGRTVVMLALLVAGGTAFALMTFVGSDDSKPQRTAAFSWIFEADDELNPDGNPKTNVMLEATYSDGELRKEQVAKTDGSCNPVPGSDVIQCYGAGFGERFKVTKGVDSYLVQRQEFEEASPDYDPPVPDYETITEFPL